MLAKRTGGSVGTEGATGSGDGINRTEAYNLEFYGVQTGATIISTVRTPWAANWGQPVSVIEGDRLRTVGLDQVEFRQ